MHQGAYITRKVLAEKLPPLLSKVERVNEKLKAGGLPIIQVTHGAAAITDVNIPGTGTARLPMIEITIAREAPSPTAGYVQLLAKSTIEKHLGAETLQHRTYGDLTDEQRERVEKPANAAACDHCTSNRNRSYIFTLDTPGGIMRVGNGCLKLFLGFEMSRWATALNEVIEEADKLSKISFREVNENEVIPLRLFLSEAIKQIALSGYQKRETGYPTGEMTFQTCQALICEDPDPAEDPGLRDQVSDVINYIKDSEYRESDKNKDYFVNLRTMIDVANLTRRQANLVASAIPSFTRYQAEIQRAEANKGFAETFIGEVGERMLFKNLTVKSVKLGSNDYGYTTTFWMTNEEGAYFKWKASGHYEMEEGGSISVSGSIKEHDKFHSSWYGKEVMCNILTRCKILSPEDVLALESKKPRKKRAAPAKTDDLQP